MKNILILITITLIIASINLYAEQENPFSEHVSKLWLDGKKSEVLDISNQLLNKNPNDIVGLILKLEYELEFLLLDNANITINKILENINTYNTPKLSKKVSALQAELSMLRNDIIPNYPPEELEKDRDKANLSNKPMGLLYILIAAEEDGLVSMDTIIP